MGSKSDNFCLFSAYFGVFSPDLLMEYGIFILTVDISAILKNIDIDIDMDRAILKKLIWIKGFGKILILKRLLWKILILIRRFWKISISIKYWIGENLAYQIRLHSMEPLAIASITFIWNNKQPYTQEYFQTKPSFSWFFYFKKNGIWYALKQNLLGRLFQSSLPCRQIFQILNIYIAALSLAASEFGPYDQTCKLYLLQHIYETQHIWSLLQISACPVFIFQTQIALHSLVDGWWLSPLIFLHIYRQSCLCQAF